MRIETPAGSGNFIEIHWGENGDLYVTIDSKDPLITNGRQTATAKLFGRGKGECEPGINQELRVALAPFAEK